MIQSSVNEGGHISIIVFKFSEIRRDNIDNE